QTIARMRLLQIDTIHVVARSPYLVLFARLGTYEPRWLDELLARGRIFECWAHEACFAVMSDYPLHRSRQTERAGHWAHKRARRMHDEQRDAMYRLLAHIDKNGPVKSSDFERKRAGPAGWWGWKDEKRWLEAWFALGELMIARRENFQRVYDLRDRVLNRAGCAIETVALDPAEAQREYLLGAVRALGITQASWIADYFRTGKTLKDADLEKFVASGELIRVDVRGWEAPGYVHAENHALLQRAQRGGLRATHTTLLSPFDPVVWDRARAGAMFDFDYRLECYTPGPKRRFGYFVLPILHRGRLIGRLDAKAHRAEGMFEVKALYLEDGVDPASLRLDEIAQAIQAFADWHATPRVVIRRSEPAAFGKSIRSMLNQNMRAPE
ncbi:MAG: crosslink repair DNA glycosylase YcaQ family protein, partial [Rudaea sp.]